MNTKVSIVKCNSYDPALVLGAVKKAINLFGGLTNFIKPESKVLIKPNLLMAKEPQYGITTHPEVMRAVIKILREINCKIFVGDSPSVWGNQIENVDRVYECTGMKKVCLEERVELVKFDKRRMREKFPLTTWLDDCDYFINLPKFKTHDLTILTGAIKNLFGLVPGTFKTELHKDYFHAEDFSGILVDIYQEVRPALTIVDSIVAMEGEGPGTSGKLRQLGLILAGDDSVAIDCILALIMGLEPSDILTTKIASERNLGIADINSISILGEKLETSIGEPFLLPVTSIRTKIPRPIVRIGKKLIRYYPYVVHDNCTRCTACIQACPNKVISIKNERIIFNYSKCIACFCCQEVCPASAIKVKKSILARMIGL
jgi:uncharacterized protein (DUF362 family)/NAD-dependent dihydropyrimidine dehydrogenase PreA subunit